MMEQLKTAAVRNALRFVAGGLVTKGVITATTAEALTNDVVLAASIEAGAGIIAAAVAGKLYSLAKRLKWPL